MTTTTTTPLPCTCGNNPTRHFRGEFTWLQCPSCGAKGVGFRTRSNGYSTAAQDPINDSTLSWNMMIKERENANHT